MGANQHPMGALFVVHGCLPQLKLVQRFEVASEIGCKRIGVRVPELIGIGFLFLRLSFPRLLCRGPLSLRYVGRIEVDAKYLQFRGSTSPINAEVPAIALKDILAGVSHHTPLE